MQMPQKSQDVENPESHEADVEALLEALGIPYVHAPAEAGLLEVSGLDYPIGHYIAGYRLSTYTPIHPYMTPYMHLYICTDKTCMSYMHTGVCVCTHVYKSCGFTAPSPSIFNYLRAALGSG